MAPLRDTGTDRRPIRRPALWAWLVVNVLWLALVTAVTLRLVLGVLGDPRFDTIDHVLAVAFVPPIAVLAVVAFAIATFAGLVRLERRLAGRRGARRP